MTKIKLCGLSRPRDIEAANELMPDYVGFVFVPSSRRYVPPEKARELKGLLDPRITAVGVFADESPETVASLLNGGVIDIAQLHGGEDGETIAKLRALTDKPVIKAFRVGAPGDAAEAERSAADYILLDSDGGSGRAFDRDLLRGLKRPYFLAGGLTPGNVGAAVRTLRPCAVDVSSGIETGGLKDPVKMAEFVAAVRKEYEL